MKKGGENPSSSSLADKTSKTSFPLNFVLSFGGGGDVALSLSLSLSLFLCRPPLFPTHSASLHTYCAQSSDTLTHMRFQSDSDKVSFAASRLSSRLPPLLLLRFWRSDMSLCRTKKGSAKRRGVYQPRPSSTADGGGRRRFIIAVLLTLRSCFVPLAEQAQ